MIPILDLNKTVKKLLIKGNFITLNSLRNNYQKMKAYLILNGDISEDFSLQ